MEKKFMTQLPITKILALLPHVLLREIFSFYRVSSGKLSSICKQNAVDILLFLVNMRAPILKFYPVVHISFVTACKKGNAIVVALLARVLPLDYIQRNHNEALVGACLNGHANVVNVLSWYLTANDVRTNNNGPLRWACENNNLTIVRILSCFLIPNDVRANSFLFSNACAQGHFELVKLLARFLTIEDMRKQDDWALKLARQYGHTTIVRFLTHLFSQKTMCVKVMPKS